MNRTTFLLGTPFLAIAFATAVTVVAVQAQDTALRADEAQAVAQAARGPRRETLRVVHGAPFVGALTRETMTERLKSFLGEFTKQHGGQDYQVKGTERFGNFEPRGIVLVYSNPGDRPNSRVRMAVGITIPPRYKIQVQSPLVMTRINRSQTYTVRRKGRLDRFRQIGMKLAEETRMRLPGLDGPAQGGQRRQQPIGFMRMMTDPNKVADDDNDAEITLLGGEDASDKDQ